MAGPGNGSQPDRDALERLLALLGPRLDEARSLFEGRLRGDRMRVGESTKQRLQDLAREVGLVTRDEFDELELRVAQLEHRLRLVEDRERP